MIMAAINRFLYDMIALATCQILPPLFLDLIWNLHLYSLFYLKWWIVWWCVLI